MSSQLDTNTTIEGFFEELLREALVAERVQLSDSASAYLLQLLKEFASKDALYGGVARDERRTPALATLYQRALESPPAERFDAYRHLGDTALVVSGFFAPQIERTLVDVSYYVKMGGAAYDAAATLVRGGVGPVFSQLSTWFGRLVEVLTRVAERTTLPVARDQGALFERLLRTPGSAELHRRLIAQGLIPLVSTRAA
ncbi:MAG: hypothetical protein U1E65_07740 [Myxococcota bacterium]